jgi:hypothetical protein
MLRRRPLSLIFVSLVVVFLKRILDVLQNGFGIGFGKFWILATRLRRLPVAKVATTRHRSEFGFNTVPVSIAHHNLAVTEPDPRGKLGQSSFVGLKTEFVG